MNDDFRDLLRALLEAGARFLKDRADLEALGERP